MSVCTSAYALHASSSILTVPSVRISQRPLLQSAFKWRLNEIRVRLFVCGHALAVTRADTHTHTHIETCYGIFARLESVAAPTHSESYVSGALCDYAIHKFIIEFIRSFDVLWFSFALLLLCDPLWYSDDMWGNADDAYGFRTLLHSLRARWNVHSIADAVECTERPHYPCNLRGDSPAVLCLSTVPDEAIITLTVVKSSEWIGCVVDGNVFWPMLMFSCCLSVTTHHTRTKRASCGHWSHCLEPSQR